MTPALFVCSREEALPQHLVLQHFVQHVGCFGTYGLQSYYRSAEV